MADNALNNGILLSNASPVYEIKTVGIHKVTIYKCGDVGSHAVYPLASNVFLILH
jgi:hypothetical protein